MSRRYFMNTEVCYLAKILYETFGRKRRFFKCNLEKEIRDGALKYFDEIKLNYFRGNENQFRSFKKEYPKSDIWYKAWKEYDKKLFNEIEFIILSNEELDMKDENNQDYSNAIKLDQVNCYEPEKLLESLDSNFYYKTNNLSNKFTVAVIVASKVDHNLVTNNTLVDLIDQSRQIKKILMEQY